ncbi:trifunctional serine/threonine-protein kinase/ATP-binding protein/sensor histidine kinase [Pararobbsia alpina]|uniref:trifunctional serine/threonine-protein kinase/ATP-binding protein/sensor histidine kinase n=1 Tax=Pararobbsia alpina TaxID=621374 RepID=UPI001FEA2410|nr:AAA family ATPase [Pararobbsia alpina]
MGPSLRFGALGDSGFQVLWEDGEHAVSRGCCVLADGRQIVVLAAQPTAEHPSSASLERLTHEYGLKNELENAWAARPLELVREGGRTLLLLEDPGGEPLAGLLAAPLEVGRFLRLGISIAAALRKVHQRGLIHKDLKPANILVNANGEVRLTGFGIASRLPRERQAPEPPETIAGTLAYMAPEQTGRMNRSIDARSDLYALGITFYQMLTGSLPFTAADPMDWVHCHIARKPVPPSERSENVPAAVSAIVMRLLAKTAEERYQTAGGAERDLQRCLTEWEAHGYIEAFPLGQQDRPDRLMIPEKLYGRSREVETLLTSFDRIVENGPPELVLVSGYSGIGKSSVVNELHKALVPPRGLFAAGKFDQLKRDIPYATLAQAFESLARPLLGKSDTELSGWRDRLLEALAPNGRLMVDVVPELKLIIGEQPPVPELPPQDAQRRFQRVFRRFIGVFAQAEHPLALFLDDLQWLDAATLDLIEDLLTRSDLQHLMLIGAYRDNEVTATDPLMRTLGAIKAAGGKVTEITLAPLAREHLGQLIADALRCERERAAPLAQLVHDKTGGNPFFAIQFIASLVEEDMLVFDHEAARWSWDLDRIHAKGYADNVVDLMVGKLTRLPVQTQAALQQLACIGHTAEIAMLSIAIGTSEEHVHTALSEAVLLDLVERLKDSYKFVHDRVQEAAYSLIPEASRAPAHLRIGRLLAAQTPPEQLQEMIFEIVGQLNRGAALIIEQEERERLAELNLNAGKRAKASTAYASARNYLCAGMAVLGRAGWTSRYELAFGLWLERAECEYLNGNFDEAEQLISELLARGASKIDKAAAYRLKVDLHVMKSEYPKAIESALECLRLFGIEMRPHPAHEEVQAEYEKIWSGIGGRPIERLIDLPLMTNPDMQAAMRVLSVLNAPAYFTADINLACLHLCHMVNITLRYGTTDASTYGYAWFGAILGPMFHRYSDGDRFCRLACDLVERHSFVVYKARTYFSTEMAALWTQPPQAAIDFIRMAFRAGIETGDLSNACYSCNHTITDLLLRGDHLDEVWQESERGLDFARKAKFRDVVDIIVSQQRFIDNMRGRTAHFSTFSDAMFDEEAFEAQLTADRMATMVAWYWILKLQARFMSGDYEAALAAARKAKALLWSTDAHIQLLDYHYYTALAMTAVYETVPPGRQSESREDLTAHLHQLREWAERCSATFRDKHALVAAEIARLDGRKLDAEYLYEEAIRSARDNGFVHSEGIANELAARFYAARGFEKIARMYLRDARYAFVRWGADGKVRQLDELYPYLREEEPIPGLTSTIGTPVEHLDLASVIKVSQAVSGEIVLEKLLDTLMRTAMTQAGAERVLLILAQGAAQRIAAEATTRGDTVTVHLRDEAVAAAALPEAVLHYVLRTGESVILDDASTESPFAADPYIRQQRARSILCLPLLAQAKLIGVLYLENSLAPRVFSPTRIAVLKLLASQAAIALENARLYRDLAEREAKIGRLVDANIVGILIWELEGRILEANDAFLRIVGYDRDDLISGRLRWTELTPPEWLERDKREWVPVLKERGTLQPFEKEYFRKDGSRVPVLIGVAMFEERGTQGVGFVLDLSERKRAEAELREVQTELAHANRAATMGQLTASIAHEVNQPISAAAINAAAAIRWLGARTPNIDEATQALERIVDDATRAGDIIGRIRDLIKKAPPRKDSVDVNEAVREVIELTRGEASRYGISVQAELEERLPRVRGDRVQLQQVMLNLIVNAIEAMSATSEGEGALLVSTATDSSKGVSIAVSDTGPGLPADAVNRVFDPFYTTKASGLGMGLSICRSIIDAYGGRLSAKPNVPRGAVFQFSLPAHADNPLGGAGTDP